MLLKLDDLARHHHQLSNYGFDCLFFLAVLWWGIEKSRPPPHHLGSSCVSRLWLFSITFCLSREDSREEQHHQLLWWGGGCYFQYLNQISAMKDFTGMREKELYIYGGHVQHMMGIAGRKKKICWKHGKLTSTFYTWLWENSTPPAPHYYWHYPGKSRYLVFRSSMSASFVFPSSSPLVRGELSSILKREIMIKLNSLLLGDFVLVLFQLSCPSIQWNVTKMKT